MGTNEHFDCVIIGGGPAGAALAITLSQWGRRCAIIDRGDRPAVFPAETIVPAAAPLLSRLGAMTSVRKHGFIGTARHGVIWGDGVARWRKNEEHERGFRVARDIFDEDLRGIARALGASVYTRHTALGPLPEEGFGTVRMRTADGEIKEIEAKTLVVAAGKTTGGGLLPLHLIEKLPPTVALGCLVARPRGGYEDATLIESVDEGWLWWLPLADGTASLTLFADTDEVRARGAREVFHAAMRHADGPARGAVLLPTFGLKATPRLLETPSRIVLIGDAASAIDPLSSQGVEKALTSGEQAAVAINTILEVPEVRADIVDHHRRWERRLFRSHATRALAFYRDEVRFATLPFWEKRHRALKVEFSRRPAERLPDLFVRSDSVVPRPTFRRRGRLYEPTVGWGAEGEDDFLFALGGVAVHPLMEILAEPRTIPDVCALAAKDPRLQLASERHVREALTELFRLGMIAAPIPGDGGERRDGEDALPEDPG